MCSRLEGLVVWSALLNFRTSTARTFVVLLKAFARPMCGRIAGPRFSTFGRCTLAPRASDVQPKRTCNEKPATVGDGSVFLLLFLFRSVSRSRSPTGATRAHQGFIYLFIYSRGTVWPVATICAASAPDPKPRDKLARRTAKERAQARARTLAVEAALKRTRPQTARLAQERRQRLSQSIIIIFVKTPAARPVSVSIARGRLRSGALNKNQKW